MATDTDMDMDREKVGAERKELPSTVYDANSKEGVLALMVAIYQSFIKGNYLAKRIFIRDFKALYRQSLLGISWAFVIPIVSTLVWVYLNNSGVVKIDLPEVPYPIYVLSGMILWQGFLDGLNAPIMSFNNAKPFLTKINFPREALILSGFYRVTFNMYLKLVILIPLFFFYGFNPGWTILMAIPLMVVVVLLGFSLGVIVTPVGILYNDVQRLIQAGSQFIFLLSPIIYPIANEGVRRTVDLFNPIGVMVNFCRNYLLGLSNADIMGPFLIHALIFGTLLVIGLVAYRISVPLLIERMGS